jgi:hypothetical protein
VLNKIFNRLSLENVTSCIDFPAVALNYKQLYNPIGATAAAAIYPHGGGAAYLYARTVTPHRSPGDCLTTPSEVNNQTKQRFKVIERHLPATRG